MLPPLFPLSLLYRFATWLRLLICVALLSSGMSAQAQIQTRPDPDTAPDQFVSSVTEQALAVLKNDAQAHAGDLGHINQLVDQYLLPYVDFERTTRLAAGRYWRQASPQQQRDLAQAFRGTLIRTYSGALASIDQSASVRLLPFRGDANADDVVVRSQVLPKSNAQPISVDYRLVKTPAGWRIYDVNVEGIWLIQNYRNQFADQIAKTGIDGLIHALNQTGQ